MPSAKSRRRLFVDPEVQGALVTRCVIYWCISLFVLFAALLSPEYVFAVFGLVSPTSPGIWLRYGPGLVIAIALTTLMVLDLLRCTNRFAGPMVRTRRFLRSLANGEQVKPISFRRGDYWQSYADELNAVLRRMQMLEEKASQAAGQDSGTAISNTVDAAGAVSWDDEVDEDADAELLANG